MEDGKYLDLIEKLENHELETLNPDVASHAVPLLAAYLYQHQLANAKNLICRISSKDNKDLPHLKLLLKALIDTNYADFFKEITTTVWPENIKEIMQDLIEKTRRNVVELVAQGYTSILETQLMQHLQMSREDLKEMCTRLEWTYDTDDQQQVIVVPSRPQRDISPYATSENQLFKLTEFVSFLEN